MMISWVFSATLSALTDGQSLTFAGVMMVSRLRLGVLEEVLWSGLGIKGTT
ncbi:UNVERIFIED_CONTAM: hypothetical protein Sangu_0840300, partial [Sesamum angustifolium]